MGLRDGCEVKIQYRTGLKYKHKKKYFKVNANIVANANAAKVLNSNEKHFKANAL